MHRIPFFKIYLKNISLKKFLKKKCIYGSREIVWKRPILLAVIHDRYVSLRQCMRSPGSSTEADCNAVWRHRRARGGSACNWYLSQYRLLPQTRVLRIQPLSLPSTLGHFQVFPRGPLSSPWIIRRVWVVGERGEGYRGRREKANNNYHISTMGCKAMALGRSLFFGQGGSKTS